MAHSMSNFAGVSDNKEQITCPVCGKKFKPAEEHIYHIGKRHNKLVCTYTCMRKWQRGEVKELSPHRREKKKNVKYGAVRIIETGEIFETIRECAAYLNRQTGNVYQSIITGGGCNGCHIEEVKEGEKK